MNRAAIIDEKLGTKFTEKIEGEWTFAGVLIEYWEEVSKSWAPETAANYLKHYAQYVLPYLDDFALKDCDRSHFDKCLDELPKNREREGHVYNQKVDRHIRWIIKKVLVVAEMKGICPNILWGTNYDLSPDEEEDALNQEELVKLKKSFEISEEIKVAHMLLSDPEEDGEKLGLALMFCLGLRNGEACARRFRDIKPFVCDKSRYYMLVYSSIGTKNVEENYSGKTGNMVRFIPIPQKLLELLFKRRDYLRRLVLSGELSIDNEANDIDESKRIETFIDGLFISCPGTNYTGRCQTRNLTLAANRLLKEVKFEQQILSLIDREFRRPGRTDDGIKEKDPTAYLFRRNLGTHLYLLGLDDSEIQYIMGHDIEDDDEERNFFRNEEKLYPIALKMEKRPIVNYTQDVNVSEKPGKRFSARDVSNEEIHIPLAEGGEKIIINIEQREPLSKLDIRVRGPVEGTFEQFAYEAPFDKTMSITQMVQKEYERKKSRMKSIQNQMERSESVSDEIPDAEKEPQEEV